MNKLIIVEGLTGSGKSIMAQFITRQMQLAGVNSEWFHEASLEHPLSVEDEEDMEVYKSEVLKKWNEFVNHSLDVDKVTVIEACFFNNCLETLFIHNEPLSKILDFGLALQEILRPLNPCLIYLVQSDTRKALEVNFANRGESFKQFVISFTEKQPVSRLKNWAGEEGMFVFWEKFVEMTHQAYEILSIDKLRIDNSKHDYGICNKKVLDFLGLNLFHDLQPLPSFAKEICGEYQPISGHKREVSFRIFQENQNLMAGFLNYRAKLIYKGGDSFEVAGWYFIFEFERSENNSVKYLNISGKDVEYLVLSGIRAQKISDF